MKIEEKSIGELINIYIKGIDSIKGYHSAWPGIAGPQLARLTEFDKAEEGVLYIRARGSAASNLVMLRKRAIINAFNDAFPDDKVSRIKVEMIY